MPRRAPWFDTLGLLRDELAHLGADDEYVVIEVDVTSEQTRKDGWPRQNATPASPRVVVATPSKWGPLRFACDHYTFWQDNVRAIADGLTMLRHLDGQPICTMGEQYLGWAVLPPEPAATSPDGFATATDAAVWLASQADDAHVTADTLLAVPKRVAALYRQLARRMHPDTPTGDADAFRRLEAARDALQRA